MNQEVRVNLYLPEGTVLNYLNESEYRCWRIRFDNDRDLGSCDMKDFTWKMGGDGELKCLECPEPISDSDNDPGDKNKVIINEEGIDIDIKDGSDSFKMKINEDGMEIKANEGDNDKEINADDETGETEEPQGASEEENP